MQCGVCWTRPNWFRYRTQSFTVATRRPRRSNAQLVTRCDRRLIAFRTRHGATALCLACMISGYLHRGLAFVRLSACRFAFAPNQLVGHVAPLHDSTPRTSWSRKLAGEQLLNTFISEIFFSGILIMPIANAPGVRLCQNWSLAHKQLAPIRRRDTKATVVCNGGPSDIFVLDAGVLFKNEEEVCARSLGPRTKPDQSSHTLRSLYDSYSASFL